ncbi:MAG: protoporphyrinogen oxidase [Anaerolineae bacterium]|nr:protoporphyrinogen oxidase [Anaerolineae bacterium]
MNIAIIGGGITGLSAAYALQTTHPEIDYCLLESDARWGGKMVTATVQNGAAHPLIIDGGPDTFVTRKREVWELVHALGLAEEITPGSETRGIYVLHGGKPIKVPLNPVAFISSPILSLRGKLRMAAEPFVPARRDDADESLGEFVSRRLGREALERFVGPILGGIYNTDPNHQSILVTSPIMRQMEAEYGGLFRATFARLRQAQQAKTSPQERPPRFIGLKGGAGVLVKALVARLTGDLHLNAGVEWIAADAAGYRLSLTNGSIIHAEGLILATPANVAARLLAEVAPQAAADLAKIKHVNIGTISIAFDKAAIPPELLTMQGVMIPRRERRRIDAVTFTSNKDPTAPRKTNFWCACSLAVATPTWRASRTRICCGLCWMNCAPCWAWRRNRWSIGPSAGARATPRRRWVTWSW